MFRILRLAIIDIVGFSSLDMSFSDVECDALASYKETGSSLRLLLESGVLLLDDDREALLLPAAFKECFLKIDTNLLVIGLSFALIKEKRGQEARTTAFGLTLVSFVRSVTLAGNTVSRRQIHHITRISHARRLKEAT